MWLVARRVAEIYSNLAAGRTSHGDPLRPLVDLLNDDAAYRTSEHVAQDRQYWIRALAAPPEPGSLTFSDRSPVHSGHFLRHSAFLPVESVVALQAAAKRAGTNLARLLSAATAVLVWFFSSCISCRCFQQRHEDVRTMQQPIACTSQLMKHEFQLI